MTQNKPDHWRPQDCNCEPKCGLIEHTVIYDNEENHSTHYRRAVCVEPNNVFEQENPLPPILTYTRAEVKEQITLAIGEASMCWSETPSGTYDSTRAIGLVERLMRLFTEKASRV